MIDVWNPDGRSYPGRVVASLKDGEVRPAEPSLLGPTPSIGCVPEVVLPYDSPIKSGVL
ncbi:MAG: hypothetical protein OXI33_00045 [Chloroflexota bacterium]|nr:hypothetical protein [Chloroflexota bacterium]